jgi:hypothetical protein
MVAPPSIGLFYTLNEYGSGSETNCIIFSHKVKSANKIFINVLSANKTACSRFLYRDEL